MKRREDWPEKLAEELRASLSRKFEWGVFDCCLFAANCIRAMTDVDVAENIRGKYKTKHGALRVVRSFGSIEKLADAYATTGGFEEVKKEFLRRGDIVLVYVKASKLPTFSALGVFNGYGVFLAGEKSLAQVPRFMVVKGWTF